MGALAWHLLTLLAAGGLVPGAVNSWGEDCDFDGMCLVHGEGVLGASGPVEYEGSVGRGGTNVCWHLSGCGRGRISLLLTSENPVTVTAEKTLTDQLNVLASQKGKLRPGES